eukprot:4104747-Amphidinium_carterae.1
MGCRPRIRGLRQEMITPNVLLAQRAKCSCEKVAVLGWALLAWNRLDSAQRYLAKYRNCDQDMVLKAP